MENKVRLVPRFKFIWLPDNRSNTTGQNELVCRLGQFTNAMDLLRKDSPVEYEFCTAPSLNSLVNALRPCPGYLPVFVLLGHGVPESGSMYTWNGDEVNPTTLFARWKCDFECDLIAAACGANVFCSPLQYPILLYYTRLCRVMPAAEPLAPFSYMCDVDNPESRHLELTQLMLHYLRVYDDGGKREAVRKADALVAKKRRTAKQRQEEIEKQRIEKEVAERANAARAELDRKNEERRTALKKWADECKTKWQQWGQARELHFEHRMAVDRWRTRWLCVFAFFVLLQLLDVLFGQGPLLSYVLLDAILYCVLLRQ